MDEDLDVVQLDVVQLLGLVQPSSTSMDEVWTSSANSSRFYVMWTVQSGMAVDRVIFYYLDTKYRRVTIIKKY